MPDPAPIPHDSYDILYWVIGLAMILLLILTCSIRKVRLGFLMLPSKILMMFRRNRAFVQDSIEVRETTELTRTNYRSNAYFTIDDVSSSEDENLNSMPIIRQSRRI